MSKNTSLTGTLHWLPNTNKRVLPAEDAKIVLRLLDSLDLFVGKESGIFDKNSAEGKSVELNIIRKEIRDYWYANLNLIDQFIQSEKGQSLTKEQQQILLGWKKHQKLGNFLCVKYCARYAVFYSMDKGNDNYYAILALTDDFEDFFPYNKPPYMVNTALLPYKDVIIWDGLVGLHGITFGKGMRTGFNEEYQQAKKEDRILTKLT